MSTLKVESIEHPSSSTPAISLDSNGGMTGSFPASNRNLLYNGAMQVHQRGTSTASITTPGYYTADRWQSFISNCGTWTQTVENDAPVGSGMKKSFKMLCTTANNSLSGLERILIIQRLEGQDVQKVKKGTPSSEKLTLSFWVKSNVTGTFIANLWDSDNTRQIAAEYNIDSANTWEKKTITFVEDSSGILNNDSGESLSLWFCLAAGPDYTSGSLSTSWENNTNANRHVGQTNLAANTNNYWQITGVQLETGPVATEFEFEPYGVTLAKCQRYYWEIGSYLSNNWSPIAFFIAGTSTRAFGSFHTPVTMRANPQVTFSQLNLYNTSEILVTNLFPYSQTGRYGENDGLAFEANTASGLTAGQMYRLHIKNISGTSGYIRFNSEL